MSKKKKKLTFTVKSSLAVGTATAALGMVSCTGAISNPIPPQVQDTNVQDTSDAGDSGDAADSEESDGSDERSDTDE